MLLPVYPNREDLSLDELISKSKPTAAGEVWMNCASATKANVVYLLKAAVQQLKQQTSTTKQIADLKDEVASLLSPPQLLNQVSSLVDSTLQTFRAEMTSTIQQEVSKAIHASSPPEQRNSNPKSYSSALKSSYDCDITRTIQAVRAEQHACEMIKRDGA